jgi:Gpi18-like mannosyltransferase
MAAAYLVTAWFIWKILRRLDPDRAMLGTTIFALNPLVIFESLVSGHYDIVMMAFAVASLYLYIQKKRLASFVLLSLSAATKIMTIALIPLFLVGWQRKWSIYLTLIGFICFIAVTGREILPWYLIWFIPWYALTPRRTWLITIGTGATLGYLLSYAPFLYFGDYSPPVPALKMWIIVIPIAISLLILPFRRHKPIPYR